MIPWTRLSSKYGKHNEFQFSIYDDDDMFVYSDSLYTGERDIVGRNIFEAHN